MLLLTCAIAFSVTAQTTVPEQQTQKLAPTEVNILSSYYSQDGDNAAVTGGIGNEHLTDFTPTVIVNVPLDTVTDLNVNFGMDYYTSASSDNVDPNSISSASSADTRYHLNVSYTRRNSARRVVKSVMIGGSTEYDVQSLQLGLSWSKESRNLNREFTLAGQVFYDSWTLIYPKELRGKTWLNEKVRQSYSVSAILTQVINKRMQGAVMADLVYQTGLLSTPFHRVYFQNSDQPLVEQLPSNRFKIPLGLRLNYYLNDYLTSRLYYRFYTDDWGITANTFEVELPIKVGPFFTLYPLYRFHTQTAADYFAPYNAHIAGEEFFTSDYDLSDFSSHKAGVGLRYSPLMGIKEFGLPFSKKRSLFKSIDLRYANYWRSNGLKAYIISTDLGFSIP
ncbi:MAG: DUF3570 domain-containing protein [Hymenobacteraceae bacterium]|nr:DUF3570 domain-containing protein [Hymenobacteraceae bacterium]MDX5394824.1 DUF3570 domain-containing protein [Hymenobacteraceae bacterium]MDX5510858.1 DUF3570 domain-containing protein [Hymenobacteraceae bacterium]